MTVCIAAMCLDQTTKTRAIIGVSDRMLTADDITFEALVTNKQIQLTSSIIAMTAGNAALQFEIIREVYQVINDRIKSDPQSCYYVKEVAELYSKLFYVAKAKRASNAILAPLGLTLEGFLSRQNEFSQDFVMQVHDQLMHYKLMGNNDGIDTIITGVDTEGPHIFRIIDGSVICCDSIGFAAIGIGARHSESQFMLNRHAWDTSVTDTLLVTYIAKRRAEIAPGVGKDTDMFYIAELGEFVQVPPNSGLMTELEKEYQEILRQEQVMLDQSKNKIKFYVESLVNQSATKQEEAVSTSDG